MSSWRNKIFALLLVFLFGMQSVNPCAAIDNRKSASSFQIPDHLGIIESTHPGSSDTTIFILRDLHANAEAQKKEISILQWLQKKNDLHWILTEGAEGPLNTALLQSLSLDPVFRKTLLNHLLSSGIMTASEYLATAEPGQWRVQGIENSIPYWSDVRIFQKVLGKQSKQSNAILSKAENHIRRTLQKNAPLRLTHYYQTKRRLDQNEISLQQYCLILKKIASTLGIKKSLYSQLEISDQLDQIHKNLKKTGLEEEFQRWLDSSIRRKPAEEIKDWIQWLLRYRLGKISTSEYLDRIESLLSAEDKKRFGPLLKALHMEADFNFRHFQDELNKLGELIEEKLINSSGLYQLKISLDHILILKKFLSLQLSHNEWDQIRHSKFSETLQQISRWRNEQFISDDELRILLPYLKEARKFYRIAQDRDELLARNCMEWMNRKSLKQAAVIAGGFHSQAIAKLLNAEGITVIVITPKIENGIDEKNYLKIMLNEPSTLDILFNPSGAGHESSPRPLMTSKRMLPHPYTQYSIMPPLRLAQWNTTLRQALEEKALFLSFLNFLYQLSPGASFVRETQRFHDELKNIFKEKLAKELEQNELPTEEQKRLIEQALNEFDQFFKTLSVQNLDKQGATLKVTGTIYHESFEAVITQDPLAQIPESVKASAETGDLKEGLRWWIAPSNMRDPHWLEVRPLIEQSSNGMAMTDNLAQMIWTKEDISLESVIKDNPELSNQFPSNKEADITPVVIQDQTPEKTTYRILTGANTLLRQFRQKKYTAAVWVGTAWVREEQLIDEYKAWEKSRSFFSGSFDSLTRSKIDFLFSLLGKHHIAIPGTDEPLFQLLRKTVFSDLPEKIQDEIIESIRKTSWIIAWAPLEKGLEGYRKSLVQTALREAQLRTKEDGKIHWESLRHLAYSASSLQHMIAWTLITPAVLRPLAHYYLDSNKSSKKEEAIRVLGTLGGEEDLLIQMLVKEDDAFVLHRILDALSQAGDTILELLNENWDPGNPKAIWRIAEVLARIKTTRSIDLLSHLYFKAPDDQRSIVSEMLIREELNETIIGPLWRTYQENLTVNQKIDFLNLLNSIPSENVLGPLLYSSQYSEPIIAERARTILTERADLALLFDPQMLSQWKATLQFFNHQGCLENLGTVLMKIQKESPVTFQRFLNQFNGTQVADSEEKLLQFVKSEDHEIAAITVKILDELQIKGNFPSVALPSDIVQSLKIIKSDQPLTFTESLDVQTFIRERGMGAFDQSIARLHQLKKHFQPDGFERLSRSLGLLKMLQIENFEEQVEIEIAPHLTLQVHPGVVDQLTNALGARISKRTIVFNSIHIGPRTEGGLQDLKKKAEILKKFHVKNFEIIPFFKQGDWSESGFNTSKNKIFQMFLEMLELYGQMYPDDPEIPAIRNKLEEIRGTSSDKSALIELDRAENLSEVKHFHTLVRYLHNKGVEKIFDTVKVRLKKGSDQTSSVTSYQVDTGGKILDYVQHPILLMMKEVYDPQKGFPETVKFFIRNMLHTVNPLHSEDAQKALHKLVLQSGLDEDFHLIFQSPHIQAMIDEHEIVAYFAMGMHTSELYANLTDPNQGGMVQFKWNEGEWKRADKGAWRERLIMIQKMLKHLGVDAGIDDWQLRARLDKETGARSVADILKVAGTILRTHASFRYLDLPLSLTGLKGQELATYLEKLAQYLNRMGKLEFYRAALGAPIEPIIEAVETHEAELRTIFNKILTSLNLAPIPEEESKPFGQVAVNRYFNKQIDEGLRAGIIVTNEQGQVEKNPTWREIRQVPEMARRLFKDFNDDNRITGRLNRDSNRQNILRMGALVRSISSMLKFTSIGTINGYPVQRAHLEILGKVLTFIVLRNHQGEILTGLGAIGLELYAWKRDGGDITNLVIKPEMMAQVLRRNGFQIPESSYHITDEDEERAQMDIQRIQTHPLVVQGKLHPGQSIPGVGISSGIAIGKIKLYRKNLTPDEAANTVWFVPFALPDHASIIRKSLATVMTGGSPLTHAGMLVREAQKPGVIVEGRWIYDKDANPLEVRIPYETFELAGEDVNDFRIQRRVNIEKHVIALQDDDVVLVNGDGEIHFFSPEAQGQARQIIELTQRIKMTKDMSGIFPLTRLLRDEKFPDLIQLAVFDLFLNSPELSSFEKTEFLRLFTLTLPQAQRSSVRSYLNTYAEGRKRKVSNILHEIKLRIPEVRQPIEMENLLSNAMNTIEDYQSLQLTLGRSGRIFRLTLVEILKLAAERIEVLRQSMLQEAGITKDTVQDWAREIKIFGKAAKLGAITTDSFRQVQGDFKRWLDDERAKLLQARIHPVGTQTSRALPFMVNQIGAKAAKLAEISRLVPVPPGFAITVKAYQQFLEKNALTDKIHAIITSELTSLEKSKQIQELIQSAPIPQELQDELLAQRRNLAAEDVAVRSSSTAEDLEKASFAGQMETLLNVRGEQAFLDSVKRIWASLWTHRAIEYRQDHHISLEVGQAVFVQKMVDAQVSGVISTINTLTNDWGDMTINAGWGLGVGPIEGRTSADQFILDMATGRLKSELIVEKTEEFTHDSGTHPASVPTDRVMARTLTDEQIATLHRYGKILENHYGIPLDIEFAVDKLGAAHILQVRPITTVNIRDDVKLSNLQPLSYKLLDNFVNELWHELRVQSVERQSGFLPLKDLQTLFRSKFYAYGYQGNIYIIFKILRKWLESPHLEYAPDYHSHLDALQKCSGWLEQNPYDPDALQQIQTHFPHEYELLKSYLTPFLGQKTSELTQTQFTGEGYFSLSQGVGMGVDVIETAIETLQSGKSIILDGDFEWVKNQYYELARRFYLSGTEKLLDEISVPQRVLDQGPAVLKRLCTDSAVIQLSKILPCAYQKNIFFRLASIHDAEGIAQINNERARELDEPERPVEYFARLLRDNPMSLVGINQTGNVSGALFISLIQSDGAKTLPQTYQEITRSHDPSELVNTMIDFWIVMLPELIPFSKTLASELGLEHLIAYSRPAKAGRLLYELAKRDQPGLDITTLITHLPPNLTTPDKLRAFLDQLDAGKKLGILVDYHTDKGLNQFMTLLLVKHLFLATRHPKGKETVSDRTPFLDWMIAHKDDLESRYDWFNFDPVWDYLHNDRINFNDQTGPYEFVERMKPILRKFLSSSQRWMVDSVLWKLHMNADISAVFPASRSDGTYQDLWTNVMMVYPLRPKVTALPTPRILSMTPQLTLNLAEQAA